mmetsp:Transcript_45981/g.143849  ORF Transcript_45981/g.143849 Transcript_45981/m.143849 type:complete len:321 (-) Transcript_45981:91-1053(-)
MVERVKAGEGWELGVDEGAVLAVRDHADHAVQDHQRDREQNPADRALAQLALVLGRPHALLEPGMHQICARDCRDEDEGHLEGVAVGGAARARGGWVPRAGGGHLFPAAAPPNRTAVRREGGDAHEESEEEDADALHLVGDEGDGEAGDRRVQQRAERDAEDEAQLQAVTLVGDAARGGRVVDVRRVAEGEDGVANGGELGGEVEAEVEERDERAVHVHQRTVPQLHIVGEGAAKRQVLAHDRADPAKDGDGDEGREGVAGEGGRPADDARLGHGKEHPRACARSEERERERDDALRVARREVLVGVLCSAAEEAVADGE